MEEVPGLLPAAWHQRRLRPACPMALQPDQLGRAFADEFDVAHIAARGADIVVARVLHDGLVARPGIACCVPDPQVSGQRRLPVDLDEVLQHGRARDARRYPPDGYETCPKSSGL